MAVPANATDVLSVADARVEVLRLDAADATFDTALSGYIEGAVEFVERHTGSALLQRIETFEAYAKGSDPMRFCHRYAFKATEIKYWTDAEALRIDPVGTVALSDTGRKVWGDRPYWQHCIWPPEDGWPDAERNTFRIKVCTGTDLGEAKGLRQAVIVAARQLWDGMPEVTMNHAMYGLMRPYLVYGPNP